MLFVVPAGLSLKTEEERCATENLLAVYREGKHAVLVRGEGLPGWTSSLSPRARGAISMSMTRRSELEGLRRELSCYTELRESGGAPAIEVREGQTVLKMPICWFSDSDRVRSTTLLGENRSDADLYFRFARALVSAKGWGRIALSAECRGGGGSTLADELSGVCESSRLCLAIADSDRTSPGGSLGSTAKALQKIPTLPVQRVEILSAKELENLLTTALISDAVADCGHAIERLQKMERIEPGEWRLFVDLKEGLKLFDLHRMGATGLDRAFWQRWLERLLPVLGRGWAPTPCRCGVRDECNCTVVPGFGEKLLKRVGEHVEKQSPKKLAERARPQDDGPLRDICELVIAWCIADRPFVT